MLTLSTLTSTDFDQSTTRGAAIRTSFKTSVGQLAEVAASSVTIISVTALRRTGVAVTFEITADAAALSNLPGQLTDTGSSGFASVFVAEAATLGQVVETSVETVQIILAVTSAPTSAPSSSSSEWLWSPTMVYVLIGAAVLILLLTVVMVVCYIKSTTHKAVISPGVELQFAKWSKSPHDACPEARTAYIHQTLLPKFPPSASKLLSSSTTPEPARSQTNELIPATPTSPQGIGLSGTIAVGTRSTGKLYARSPEPAAPSEMYARSPEPAVSAELYASSPEPAFPTEDVPDVWSAAPVSTEVNNWPELLSRRQQSPQRPPRKLPPLQDVPAMQGHLPMLLTRNEQGVMTQSPSMGSPGTWSPGSLGHSPTRPLISPRVASPQAANRSGGRTHLQIDTNFR